MVPISLNLLPFPAIPSYSKQSLRPWRGNDVRILRLRPLRAAAITPTTRESFDPELRSVLELATDRELLELENILFGPSYFSPLLKSISSRPDVDYIPDAEYFEERDDFIVHLESRFLFLAADARSTLRGWRPSYRNVLLGVRKKMNVPCSSKLSTEDLEVEIFLHLLQEYSSVETGSGSFPLDGFKLSNGQGSLEVGLSQWKVHGLAALRVGAKELQQMVLKGGGMLTLSKIFELLARRLSGSMILEAANYEIKNEIIKKGGQLAAVNLESRAALLAARQGFEPIPIPPIPYRCYQWTTPLVVLGFGSRSIKISRAQEHDNVTWTVVMGKISSGCCDSDAWHRLCSSSSSYLCICSDPPDENIWVDIQQGLIIHDCLLISLLKSRLS